MFEQLFKRPSTISAHSNAPYAEERRLYLAACAQQGNSRSTLVFDARDLLWVARKLNLYPDLHQVSIEQVRALANDSVVTEQSPPELRSLEPQWHSAVSLSPLVLD